MINEHETVTLSIDGREVKANPTLTIREATKGIGLTIPGFCRLPKGPDATEPCGLCLVEEIQRFNSVCTYCGTGCSLEIHTQNNVLIEVKADHSQPPNHGDLCVKGRFGFDFYRHPDRLTRPPVRESIEDPFSNNIIRRITHDYSQFVGSGENLRLPVREQYRFTGPHHGHERLRWSLPRSCLG